MKTLLSVVVLCLSAVVALGQSNAPSVVNTPASSIPNPEDAGQRAHTNLKILGSAMSGAPQTAGPPFPGYFYETPASIACIYGLVPPSAECNPNVVTENPTRGSRALAMSTPMTTPTRIAICKTSPRNLG